MDRLVQPLDMVATVREYLVRGEVVMKSDMDLLNEIMASQRGFANPTVLAEEIVRQRSKLRDGRGGDGSIVAKAASPHSRDCTPRMIDGFGVSWEPVE